VVVTVSVWPTVETAEVETVVVAVVVDVVLEVERTTEVETAFVPVAVAVLTTVVVLGAAGAAPLVPTKYPAIPITTATATITPTAAPELSPLLPVLRPWYLVKS
jgi:hypothetical protein